MQKIRKNWWANSTILRCEQQKQPQEVFCQKKKVFLEISQNSKENKYARDSLIKLQAWGLQLY